MPAPFTSIREVDISAFVEQFNGLSVGAVVHGAVRGPVNEAVFCSSTTSFLRQFTPNSKIEVGMDNSYYSILAALEKSGCWIVRPKVAGQLYSGAMVNTAVAAAKFTNGEEDPEAIDMTTESFALVGANPGVWADDIRFQTFYYKQSEPATVVTVSSSLTVAQDWGTGFPVRISAATLPDGLTANTTYYAIRASSTSIKLATTLANAKAGTNITLATTGTSVVISPAVEYTRVPGTFLLRIFRSTDLNNPIEEWVCSKDSNKLVNGRNAFIETVLKGSEYVRAIDNAGVSSLLVYDNIDHVQLDGGDDGDTPTDGESLTALEIFRDPDVLPITVLINSGRTTAAYQKELVSIAEGRQDCVALLSCPYEVESATNYLNAIVDYRKTTLNINSSFASLTTGYVKIRDRYTDREVWVSPDGYVAGLISETAVNYKLWEPAAGLVKGQLNVLDVKRHYTKAEMDYLYDSGINPIRFASQGRGIVLWGQKTLYSMPSALNRLNVRFALIAIEPQLKTALETFLFDRNTPETRQIVKLLIESKMDAMVADGAFLSYQVKCDDENNLPNDISNHRLVVDLVATPVESVEEIPLTIGITRNGLSNSVAISTLR